jgi:hypothetical protein
MPQQEIVREQSNPVVNERFGDNNEVTVMEVDSTSSANRLRGRSPDLIVLTTNVPDQIRREVISPMTAANGAQVIDLT